MQVIIPLNPLTVSQTDRRAGVQTQIPQSRKVPGRKVQLHQSFDTYRILRVQHASAAVARTCGGGALQREFRFTLGFFRVRSRRHQEYNRISLTFVIHEEVKG